jgi:hypothetical protein
MSTNSQTIGTGIKGPVGERLTVEAESSDAMPTPESRASEIVDAMRAGLPIQINKYNDAIVRRLAVVTFGW